MKRLRWLVLGGCLMTAMARGEDAAPVPQAPGEAEVAAVIRQLGSEAPAERGAAQRRLESWAATAPRAMILHLARAYADTDNLEIEVRLQDMLEALARTWMFYQPVGFLGINFRMIDLGDGEAAVEVLSVLSEQAADIAGLRVGDRVLEVNGKTIGSLGGQEGFLLQVSEYPPGSGLDLLVQRRETRFRMQLQLGMRPVDQLEPSLLVQNEERKLRNWLRGLRGDGDWDPRFPEGHFRIGD